MHITFYGATREVTGSKHLLTLNNGMRILLDCGLFQGSGNDVEEHNRHFGFNPREIDMVVLSHAHIDHCGLLPKLVKEGFQGPIFCTPATYDLAEVLLLDSAHIQESDVKYINNKRKLKGLPPIQPIYTIEDAEYCMQYFHVVPYNKKTSIAEGVELTFNDNGHILGSASVSLRIKEGNQYRRIGFTGDIGRYTNRILKSPQPFPQCDYLIAESTYGNRLHDKPPRAKEKLLQAVLYTCVEKKGKLIIPAFSVGRTQEVVNILNDLHEDGKLPRVRVYVDSPLAFDATEIFRRHPDAYNDAFRERMKHDNDPFGFAGLTYTRSEEESKRLNSINEPCIIISASGMIEGGRVKHHVKNSIGNPRNTILMVGFSAKGSLGGQLAAGAKEVRIFGEYYPVVADVQILNAFSAHGDYEEMIKYLSCQNPQVVQQLFLVHGEEEAMQDYQGHLEEAGFRNIIAPQYRQTVELGGKPKRAVRKKKT